MPLIKYQSPGFPWYVAHDVPRPHATTDRIRNMAPSDTSRFLACHVLISYTASVKEFHCLVNSSKLLISRSLLISLRNAWAYRCVMYTFAQCIKKRLGGERYWYIYAIHKEASRCVNDTCTKSTKNRKDALIIAAFIVVYLTWSFLNMQSSSLSTSFCEKHSLYHRVHFSSHPCFQQPERSFSSFMMQKNNQVEFILSTHIMFPYTRQYTLV